MIRIASASVAACRWSLGGASATTMPPAITASVSQNAPAERRNSPSDSTISAAPSVLDSSTEPSMKASGNRVSAVSAASVSGGSSADRLIHRPEPKVIAASTSGASGETARSPGSTSASARPRREPGRGRPTSRQPSNSAMVTSASAKGTM